MDDPHFNELRNIILPDAETQPDRSLAIVFVAVIDDHLSEALRTKLVENKKVSERLFTGLGPLETFSSRIDLGLLLGLYRDDFAKVLHGLRKIRNEFAHNMHPLTFESSEIRGPANVFEFVIRRVHREQDNGREQFLGVCKFVIGALMAAATLEERLAPRAESRL